MKIFFLREGEMYAREMPPWLCCYLCPFLFHNNTCIFKERNVKILWKPDKHQKPGGGGGGRLTELLPVPWRTKGWSGSKWVPSELNTFFFSFWSESSFARASWCGGAWVCKPAPCVFAFAWGSDLVSPPVLSGEMRLLATFPPRFLLVSTKLPSWRLVELQ